ncbi:glycosyltransferase family 4 protein [Moritella sp. Urea-trap-13]|uniref:glycosyltransferase family 4 protein n=1 Tax=Moritella sp. Urea-trap-13 TaxID=2058327 RepID=UPI0012FF125F|nr:glycosyltransferase family 4 protein [Moritella sp. Urea-trap-13]
MCNKIKVAFLHSNCKDFRFPVFNGLSKNEGVDIDFFLLDEPCSKLDDLTLIDSVRIPLCQDLVIPFNLSKELNKKQYDVIISTDLGYAITYVGFYHSIRNKIRFILWNEQWADVIHPRRFITKPLERYIVKNCYKILSFGNKQKKYLLDNGAELSQLIHAPNVVPLSNIPFHDDLYIKDIAECEYILCFGRLVSFKGQASLIKAFKLISDKYPLKKLLLAGEGPEYKKLHDLVNKLGLSGKVIIPNKKVLTSQKYSLLNKAEMVVLPSIRTRTTEAWGLVVNEAATLGKPIIVSDHTGVADDLIINNESGLVYSQNNEVELYKCIEQYINNPTFSLLMGANAKKKIEDYFNVDVLINKILRSFDE